MLKVEENFLVEENLSSGGVWVKIPKLRDQKCKTGKLKGENLKYGKVVERRDQNRKLFWYQG